MTSAPSLIFSNSALTGFKSKSVSSFRYASSRWILLGIATAKCQWNLFFMWDWIQKKVPFSWKHACSNYLRYSHIPKLWGNSLDVMPKITEKQLSPLSFSQSHKKDTRTSLSQCSTLKPMWGAEWFLDILSISFPNFWTQWHHRSL